MKIYNANFHCRALAFHFFTNNSSPGERKESKLTTSSKMKKYLLTLATAVALVACSGGAPSPSGDADKDAQAMCEYMESEIEQCKTIDELQQLDTKMKPMQEEFNKFSSEHPEYKEKFQKAAAKEVFKIIGVLQKKQQELGASASSGK